MKKLLIILLLLSSISLAVDPLKSIPADKRHHIGSTYILCDIMKNVLDWDDQQIFFGVFMATLLKGMIDQHYGGTPDVWDGVANFTALGMFYTINFDWGGE